MTLDDYDDNELLALYGQSVDLLTEAIENDFEFVVSEYEIRHRAILAVCRSRGLIVVDVFDHDTDAEQPPNAAS